MGSEMCIRDRSVSVSVIKMFAIKSYSACTHVPVYKICIVRCINLAPPEFTKSFILLVLLKYLIYERISTSYISLEREFLIDPNDMLFVPDGGHYRLSG